MIKFFKKLSLLFFILIFLPMTSSCSSITFTSDGVIPVYVGRVKKHNRKRSFSGVKRFFLWGQIPGDQKVIMDKEFRKQGLFSVANLTIEEFQTTGQFFQTLLSLGVFSVKSFKVTGYGMEAKDFD